MRIKRSPLFYVGDKYKILPKIKPLFPEDIGRFIEPFLGGGSVFMNVEAREYLLNDVDDNIYKLHVFLHEYSGEVDLFFRKCVKVIKKYGLTRSFLEDIVPQEMKTKWKKTYYARYNKKGFNNLRAHYNESPEKEPLELYLLLIYGFNRMIRFNARGHYNVPVGNVDFNSNVVDALKDYFQCVREKNIKMYHMDYKDFLLQIKFREKDFLYLDPPYLISASEYNKLWGEEEEKELVVLLDRLANKGVRFAISNLVLHKGKRNYIFGRWMKKYNVYSIKSNYISYHDNSQKKSEEVLVTNYEKKVKV